MHDYDTDQSYHTISEQNIQTDLNSESEITRLIPEPNIHCSNNFEIRSCFGKDGILQTGWDICIYPCETFFTKFTFLNIIDNGFLISMGKTNLTFWDYLSLCPGFNVLVGSIRLLIGIIFLPFSLIISFFFKDEKENTISWIEWSIMNIMCGLIVISWITYIIICWTNITGPRATQVEYKYVPSLEKLKSRFDYDRPLYLFNPFSLHAFVHGKTDMMEICFRIPIISFIPGIFKLLLGTITLPFTALATIFIKTASMNWLVWSLFNMLIGALGCLMVVTPIIYMIIGENIPWINDEYINNDWWKMELRSWKEICMGIKYVAKQLNPWSMDFLLNQNTTQIEMFTAMDKISCIFIISIIPGILRFFVGLIALIPCIIITCIFVRRGKVPLAKICFWMIISGFISCTIILSPINLLLFKYREEIFNLTSVYGEQLPFTRSN